MQNNSAIATRIANWLSPNGQRRLGFENFTWARFTRFVVVGVCNTAVFFLVFAFMSGHLGLARWLAVTIAFVSVTGFQYAAHTLFTFERKARDLPQAARYAISICIGLLVSQVIMLSGPTLGLPEFITGLLVIVALALLNWVIFAVWVFRGR